MKTKLLLCFFLIMLYSESGFAQVPINNFTIEVLKQPLDSVLDPGGTMVSLECSLGIDLDVNLAKIHIQVGTTSGGNNILTYSFTPENLSKLPDDLFYTVENDEIRLGLGHYTQQTLYVTARIEDAEGHVSSPKTKQ